MGRLRSPLCFLSLLVLFLAAESADYTSLVYKGSAKQALTDPSGVYSQALSSLFGSLVSQSSKTKFFKTSAGGGQTNVSGLFQCRGDLSNVDCYNCVSRLPVLIDKLCGGDPAAARVQLQGCYMLYEVAGFSEVSGMEMLYKTCSGKNAAGSGFDERRDAAFSALTNNIGSSPGFYTTSYQSVYVLGQCEGDLSTSDCGNCVKTAVQRTQVECGSSVSVVEGVKIDYCNNAGMHLIRVGSGTNTGKTVAIILGGAVGVGFVVVLLMFARNLLKKHDGEHSKSFDVFNYCLHIH
ncbi:unnamed protein product [Thlaspi arvense]|uniref:Gnk2-homologous domain-containing protein n=1 Tax=Thlaspi arvense TaxID=13288 RepID=A0AAU9S792_THLAR|nr:unnamed protein product [Thlaspi arvense]